MRKTLGVTAFGINAYTAANAGDEVVEDHTEPQLGHEEIYAVVAGHATFTVDGEEVDAPAGTLVYLDDPAQQRSAVAKEPNTTVLAIGGSPGSTRSPRGSTSSRRCRTWLPATTTPRGACSRRR